MKKTSDFEESAENASTATTEPSLRLWIGAAVLTAVVAMLVVIGCSVVDSSSTKGDDGEGGNINIDLGGITSEIMKQNPSIKPVTVDGNYTVSEGEPVYDSRTGMFYETILVRETTGGLRKKAVNTDSTADIWGTLWLARNVGADENDKYGRLYSWDSAGIACGSVGTGTNGKKWSLPTREDWEKLIKASGKPAASAGSVMKKYIGRTDSVDHYSIDSTGWAYRAGMGGTTAAKIFGFKAVGAGYRDKDGFGNGSMPYARDTSGLWWTDTKGASGTAYYRGISWNSLNVIENTYGTGYRFSVRCVMKDSTMVDVSNALGGKDTLWLFQTDSIQAGHLVRIRLNKTTGGSSPFYGDSCEVFKGTTGSGGEITGGTLGRDSVCVVCSSKVSRGVDVSIIADSVSADGKYRFARWEGSKTGSSDSVLFAVNKKMKVYARYMLNIKTLKVTVKEGGRVGVDSTYRGKDSIDVGTKPDSCWAGDLVTLKAIPKTGYRFLGWSGESFSGTDSLKIKMDGNKAVTATFQKVYTLIVTKGGRGGDSVIVTPSTTRFGEGGATDTFEFDVGQKVTLFAKGKPGVSGAPDSVLKNWTGSAIGNSNPLTITMNANKTITAVFDTAGAGGGTGSSSGDGSTGTGTDVWGIWDVSNMTGGTEIDPDRGTMATYGGLYNWDAAKAACENAGGSLPSRKDWEDLIKTTNKSSNTAGSALRDSTFAVPFNKLGGYIDLGGVPHAIDTSGLWWTSEEGTGVYKNSAYYVGLNNKTSNVTIGGAYDKRYLFSVRCVSK